jgi:hypothetical protein
MTFPDYKAAKRLGITPVQLQIAAARGAVAKNVDGSFSSDAIDVFQKHLATLTPAQRRKMFEPLGPTSITETLKRRAKEREILEAAQPKAERKIVPDIRVSDLLTHEKVDFINTYGAEIFQRALRFGRSPESMSREEIALYKSERQTAVEAPPRGEGEIPTTAPDPILKGLSVSEKVALIRERGQSEFLRLVRRQG